MTPSSTTGRLRPIRCPFWLVLCVLGPIAATGCSQEGPQRYDLYGLVTFQGEKVPNGSISFTPDTAAGNSGPGCFAQIKNGQYETPNGMGTVGGPHRVQIFGYSNPILPEGASATEDAVPEVLELFPPYTTTVDLPKEDAKHDFEVPATSAAASR